MRSGPRHASRWTRENIVYALDLWYRRHLRSPTAFEWERASDDYPSRQTVLRVSGSWNAALAAAGLRPRRQETPDYPDVLREQYRPRRDTLCRRLERLGWNVAAPRATMFVRTAIPEAFRSLGSLEFFELLRAEAAVTTTPGVSFGPRAEGFVRFALVENDHRIRQALRNLGAFFRKQPEPVRRQTA